MPRAKREPGAEPKPKAPPKTDPLEGLDYVVEKRDGKWVAECLGVTAYGVTKKAALSMLAEELNGFKGDTDPTIPPVINETSIPAGATCQEASPFGKGEYVPCGAPATAIVFHEKDKRSYLMCFPCADHNVRGRGGVYRLVPQEGEAGRAAFGPESSNFKPIPVLTKAEAYSIEDAELLWDIEFPSKPELLRQLLTERIQLKVDADMIKERVETINKSLLGFFDRQGVERVTWEDWTVAKVNGSNSTLDKEALVLAGVPAETIARCTKRKEYVTVRVTGPKGGSE